MTRGRFLVLALLVLVAGGALRTLWLRADPPTTSVGVVWHDEGAWVHNARNRALWGVWRTDNWNPVYVAPVFTALEYGAFATLGVGTWQARVVPVASGMLALGALMVGLYALWRPTGVGAGQRVALVGGVLLAANFTWVMWNRAALMESTMTAFIVAAWAAYAMGERRPVWGFVAGIATVLAWFTKASAAFFAAAIVADALWILSTDRFAGVRSLAGVDRPSPEDRWTAWLTLAGLTVAGLAVLVVFVVPHWQDYWFYNWQMSVQRKPAYDIRSLLNRASWLPIVQDFFTRMWLVLVAASLSAVGVAIRWRAARPAERLLLLWMLVGLLELTIHDSGNERRYVMFLPALVALAAGLAAPSRELTGRRELNRWLVLPVIALFGYLVFGSLLRWIFDDQVQARDYRMTVRLAAAAAVALAAAAAAFSPWARQRPAFVHVPARMVLAMVLVSVLWDLGQFGRWAIRRTDLNYRASVALGAALAPGTLVHGKLANGLSLENAIRPIFVGRGFGNYDDRLSRDDARYILTIGLPDFGRDSQPGLIQEILDRYPNRKVIATFEVDETPRPDQAWLIDKFPGVAPAAVAGSSRAPD
jgi:hypothetical protein